jgi:hypothetical protein
MNRIFFAVIISLLSLDCKAQPDSVPQDAKEDFLFFLLRNHQLDDFVFLGDSLLADNTVSSGYKDTIAFFMGEAFLKLNNDSTAIKYFKMVSDESPFIYSSQFKTSYYETGIKKYNDAYNRIENLYCGEDTVLNELKTLQLAGVTLLKKNISTFDSITAGFFPVNSIIRSELKEMNIASLQLQNSKRKSPFIAGALSAIIPGLGKFYTGKNGEGVAAFLKVAPLAAIAVENYSKNGWKDPQFLIFSSLFGLFYIGNIWGSALSAQIVYNERINEIDHNIRVSLSMSVEQIFR